MHGVLPREAGGTMKSIHFIFWMIVFALLVFFTGPKTTYPVGVEAMNREQFTAWKELTFPKPLTVREFAHKMAVDHGQNPKVFMDVISCESGWQEDIQSKHRYTSNKWAPAGTQEQSFGIVQIHLPAHQTITKEQALDPYWSIEWMAQQWQAGNQRWWSCYPR